MLLAVEWAATLRALGELLGHWLTEYRGGLAYRCLRQAGVWVQDAIHIPGCEPVICRDGNWSKGWSGSGILDGHNAALDVFDLLPVGRLAVSVGS